MSIINLDTNIEKNNIIDNNIIDNIVKKRINKLEKEIRNNIANICDIEDKSSILNMNKFNKTNVYYRNDDLPISNFDDFNLIKFLNLSEKDLYQTRRKKIKIHQ